MKSHLINYIMDHSTGIRAQTMVVTLEFIPLAPFPQLMEAQSVGIRHYAVGRTVKYGGTTVISGGRFINGQAESRLNELAAQLQPADTLELKRITSPSRIMSIWKIIIMI